MAREFFDYDPLTGLTEYLEFTNDGKMHLTTEADVEPVVDYAKFLSNTSATDAGIKADHWLYAVIPPVVQMQMLTKGINIADPNDKKKMIAEINANYPYLKTTTLHHALK
jgi:hypothetical protein